MPTTSLFTWNSAEVLATADLICAEVLVRPPGSRQADRALRQPAGGAGHSSRRPAARRRDRQRVATWIASRVRRLGSTRVAAALRTVASISNRRRRARVAGTAAKASGAAFRTARGTSTSARAEHTSGIPGRSFSQVTSSGEKRSSRTSLTRALNRGRSAALVETVAGYLVRGQTIGVACRRRHRDLPSRLRWRGAAFMDESPKQPRTFSGMGTTLATGLPRSVTSITSPLTTIVDRRTQVPVYIRS